MSPAKETRDNDEGKDGMAAPESARPPTPFERFVAATKRVLSVSKTELDKREAKWRKQKNRKRPGS